MPQPTCADSLSPRYTGNISFEVATDQFKPDFDMCLARIYAWYEQRIIDRQPVRFLHHNIEYEKHRTVKGPWNTSEERWLDVDFQIQTFMVGYTEMYAGIDCTSMLRGTEKLCLDLILRPEPHKHLIDLVFEEFPQVYNHFDRILKEHNQLSATWMNLPSFETFHVLASDFATNISPVHFEEFCMPMRSTWLKRDVSMPRLCHAAGQEKTSRWSGLK